MKHLSTEPFKNWFGYTRRERRSSLVLLLLIILVAGVRYLFPDRDNIDVIPLNYTKSDFDTSKIVKVDYTIPAAVRSAGSVHKKKINLLDLNTCDSASLEALPGIGPVLSVRIIKYRNLLGGYASVSQLLEVYGLTPETFDLISSKVKADSTAIRKINVNNADYKQLIRMPYLEKSEVNAILKYREEKGRIVGMNELIENKLIAEERVVKVRPYLEFQ